MNFLITPVHISKVKPGDSVMINDKVMTVNAGNLKKDGFMGTTLFGDSFLLGRRPVNLVTFPLPKNA